MPDSAMPILTRPICLSRIESSLLASAVLITCMASADVDAGRLSLQVLNSFAPAFRRRPRSFLIVPSTAFGGTMMSAWSSSKPLFSVLATKGDILTCSELLMTISAIAISTDASLYSMLEHIVMTGSLHWRSASMRGITQSSDRLGDGSDAWLRWMTWMEDSWLRLRALSTPRMVASDESPTNKWVTSPLLWIFKLLGSLQTIEGPDEECNLANASS